MSDGDIYSTQDETNEDVTEDSTFAGTKLAFSVPANRYVLNVNLNDAIVMSS